MGVFEPLPKKKYNIILMDCPWDYDNFQSVPKTDKNKGSVSSQYPTVSVEDLKKLPIQDISDNDCLLFMWATFPKLQEALDLIKHYGFEYKTCAFAWAKTQPKKGTWVSGMGFYTKSNVEIVLLGRKGDFKRQSNTVRQLLIAPLGKHSAKPHAIYTRIEKLCGDVPRIELFARGPRREGWDIWGQEANTNIKQSLLKVE